MRREAILTTPVYFTIESNKFSIGEPFVFSIIKFKIVLAIIFTLLESFVIQ